MSLATSLGQGSFRTPEGHPGAKAKAFRFGDDPRHQKPRYHENPTRRTPSEQRMLSDVEEKNTKDSQPGPPPQVVSLSIPSSVPLVGTAGRSE